MKRRNFIKCAVMTCLSCSAVFRGIRLASAEENYYLEHRDELVKGFKDLLGGVRQMTAAEFGEEKSGLLAERALKKFESLLPEMPEVGGAKNIDTEFIPIAAWYVALYDAMRQWGKSPEDVGRLIYTLNEYSPAPPDAKEKGAAVFAPEGQAELMAWAKWTQQKEYAAGWVAYHLQGDGQDYDYGIDYRECGVVKYLTAQQMPELAKYVCANDFIKSRNYGTGLVRSKTIARGDGICNFRYKKDGPVLQNWQSEVALIEKTSSK